MAQLVFESLASGVETAGRNGLALGIKREGGEFIVRIARDGAERTENYPNRAQAWERVRALGGVL